MKELKFRVWYYDGKNLDSEEMLEGIPIGWSESLISNIVYIRGEWTNCIKIMQYTGLKDKNGKEIYEGDIVNFNGVLVVIEWNEAEGMFWGGNNKQKYILQYADMLKVVGNIYENPKLLEKIND